MSIQNLAWVFAAVFILVGLLGFVPGITSDGMLLGIFMVNMLHNIIHLASGIAAAAAASKSEMAASMYFKIFGMVYAVVALAGLFLGDVLMGLIGHNMANTLLHIAIAGATLAIGFGMKPKMGMMGAAAAKLGMK